MASATAEPLPLPPPAPEPGPLDLMLQVAAGATNGTNPDAVVGAAQSSQNFTQAATNAQAIAGYSTASAAAKSMQGWSDTNQQQAWDQMSPGHQDMLKAVGYKPPNDQGGILADIQKIGSDVLHNRVVSDITNALGAPLRAEQHVERTVLAKFTTPADWAQAWDETTNGQSYIDPGFKTEAMKRWGPDTYTLAYKLATGQQPQQVLQSYPQAQQGQVATALNSPDVQQATRYLSAGHLSEGRMVADLVVGQGRGGYANKALGGSFYNWLSGGVDALMSWFGDPFVIGGKLAADANHARFLVKDGQDVMNLYARSQSVRSQMARLGNAVRHITSTGEGAYQALELNKGLTNAGVIQHLIEAQADSQEKVRDWFTNEANLKAWIEGTGLHAGDPAQIPHLSYKGTLALHAKGVLSKVQDWGTHEPIDLDAPPDTWEASQLNPQGVDRIRIGTGRLVTRAYRLMPTSHIFNPNAPNAMANLRDIASMWMNTKTVDRVLGEFATNPDLGARWRLYRSLMQGLGHAAGLKEGTAEWDEVIGKYVSGMDRVYAPGNVDKMYVAGNPMHVGVLKAHMNDGWLVPSFKDLYTGVKKMQVAQVTARGINAAWLDRFMGVWRPLTLARLGFALRVGGEEAFGFLLREGPLSYLRAEAANLSAHYEARSKTVLATAAKDSDDIGLDEPAVARGMAGITRVDHARFYSVLKAGLSRKQELAEKNIAGVWKARFVNSVVIPMERAGKALTVGQYRAAVDDLVARGWLDEGSPFNEHLTAMHGYDDPNPIPDDPIKIKDRGRLVPGEWERTGGYKGYSQTEDLYKIMWQRQLHQIASDDWGRQALMLRRPEWAIRNDLANSLLEDPDWKMSMRSVQTSGGKAVSTGDATLRDAAEDHAQKVIDMVNRLVRRPHDHEPIQLEGETLADHMLRTGQAPPWYASAEAREEGETAQLANVAHEDMPTEVSGPEMVPSFRGFNVRKITDHMFRHYVSPQINWISRQPMFIHNYAVTREGLLGKGSFAAWQRRLGNTDEHIADMVHDMSTTRAINLSVPYIHNPELRSQMSQVTRNLAPFWFAQEQFYKRWGRTFVYSPWAYRQAQLISGGLSHMGFIHTDPENGQEYFVYPASALATDVISHVLGAFGVQDEVPVEADLTGYVSMLNPGLNRGFLPNFGPVAVVPMDGLKMLDPHFSEAINGLEGGNASSSSFLSSVLPSVVLRAIEATPGLGQMLDPSQYASAMMSAIQYREATGQGLAYPALTQVGTGSPPKTDHGYRTGDYFLDGTYSWVLQPNGKWVDNSPQAMTQWLKETQQWARTFFFTRLLYGFGGPASPENYFDPTGMSAQLQTLMNELPYQQATAAFMQMHPNATAMTVFQTQDNVDGFLPSTQAAMNFLDANPTLTGKFPMASTYFIPYPDTSGKFNLAAYQEQLAEGLRTQRTPSQYWTEIAYQEAANDYFAVETYKNQLLASHQAPKQQVNEMWTRFSESFLAANPLFASMYNDTNGPYTRAAIMTQIGEALNDPATPRGPQYDDTRELYNAYRDWQSLTGNFGQPNAPSTTAAYTINVQFVKWVADFTQAHPDVSALVQRVIQPDLSSTLTDMAAQGQTVTL